MSIETQLADVVALAIKAATAPLVKRIVELEAHTAVAGPIGPEGRDGQKGLDGVPGPAGQDGVPGRDGVDGKDGPPGPAGKDGAIGRDGVVPDDWSPRLKALEDSRVDLVSSDEVIAEVGALLRRDLLGAVRVPPKMQKRIIRDRQGKIARVIDEPVEAS
ncbi:MAG TPA: hypothetical protein VM243_07360 [Phycisphaerae bacterium]|nr:hypothetical protein [Phycisphaerae bacterium]